MTCRQDVDEPANVKVNAFELVLFLFEDNAAGKVYEYKEFSFNRSPTGFMGRCL